MGEVGQTNATMARGRVENVSHNQALREQLAASIIEAALLEFTGEYDADRLNYGIKRFSEDWYKGDGWYGDGEAFHLDYYNSLVIHPMLTEVLRIMKKHNLPGADILPTQEKRHGRLAAGHLGRLIIP